MALEWFGSEKPRFSIIKRYFLPDRDESFLKEMWEGSENLLKKRSQMEKVMGNIDIDWD